MTDTLNPDQILAFLTIACASLTCIALAAMVQFRRLAL